MLKLGTLVFKQNTHYMIKQNTHYMIPMIKQIFKQNMVKRDNFI